MIANLPRYRCHKEVSAIKIADIQMDYPLAKAEGRESDGHAILTPAQEGAPTVQVSVGYLDKHTPEVGGYYVLYDDGYESYSPAHPFEQGYTRI